jgi:hypothetical protein
VSTNETAASQPEPGKPRRRWKRWTAIAGIAAVVLIVGLVLPTWLGGWAPVLHRTCVAGAAVKNEQIFVPAVLANSPYGGKVFDNGSLPADLPGAPGYPTNPSALGAPARNGSAAGAFFIVNLGIHRSDNSTAWGPGANVVCTTPFIVDFLPVNSSGHPSVVAFVVIPTPSNLSNVGEASQLIAPPTVVFSNAYEAGNDGNVSTCGGPARWIPFESPHLTVWVQLGPLSGNATVPIVLPFPMEFNYWFPANFGTWQVDNLSAAGGPGGGWAFSYSPCP